MTRFILPLSLAALFPEHCALRQMPTQPIRGMRHARSLTEPNAMNGPAIFSQGHLTVITLDHLHSGPRGSFSVNSSTRWGCEGPQGRSTTQTLFSNATECPLQLPVLSSPPGVVPLNTQHPRTKHPCQITRPNKVIAVAVHAVPVMAKVRASQAAAVPLQELAVPHNKQVFRNS